MMPPADLKARVLAAAAAEPAPIRPEVVRGTFLDGCVATAIALGIFFAMGGAHAGERPGSFVAATAAGGCAVALAATLGVVRRGSMLGRSRAALIALSLAVPVALFAGYAVWLSCWPVAAEPVPIAQGAVCLALTLAMASVPFVIFARSRRDSDPVHPHATGAAIGALAGAWASVLIGLHCEHVELLHVAVGHVLPVALLAGVGAVVGGRVIGLKSRAPVRPRS